MSQRPNQTAFYHVSPSPCPGHVGHGSACKISWPYIKPFRSYW